LIRLLRLLDVRCIVVTVGRATGSALLLRVRLIIGGISVLLRLASLVLAWLVHSILAAAVCLLILAARWAVRTGEGNPASSVDGFVTAGFATTNAEAAVDVVSLDSEHRESLRICDSMCETYQSRKRKKMNRITPSRIQRP